MEADQGSQDVAVQTETENKKERIFFFCGKKPKQKQLEERGYKTRQGERGGLKNSARDA